jgi:hypothetical protein
MKKENKKEEDIKSPVLQTEQIQIDKPDYTEEETKYIAGLRTRLENARAMRDQDHEELDGMDYITYYESNERLANTFIQPKKNKEDSNFQSGVIRQKLMALLSPIVNLDLRGDLSAFSQEGFEVQAVGDGMEDIILKTNELDEDDEKKILRQYELLKQGTVFVEEEWCEKTKVVKKEKNGKKFTGKVEGFDFEKAIKKAYARPTRNIIPGPNVYLGDITKYNIQDQPFIFTVDIKPYEEAKRIFGKWERWDMVPRKIEKSTERTQLFNKDWTLLQIKEGYVEIIRYQDKWNNEFALMLNGILMTPVGMPFPWNYEDYNIAQQNLEPIHAKFAYGKSLVARTKNKAALLDETMKLAILKNQKSFMPPYLNVSGRIVSNRIFMPGKITHGISPNTLIPVNEREAQGVTTSELNMIKEIQRSVDAETVSPTFQGQQTSGNPTATEVIELQRQAKMMLGLTITAASMLEWKLEWLRLQNILAHWFDEKDEVVDKAKDILRTRYRKVTTEKMIEDEGIGKRIVIPTEKVPSPQAIMQTEDQLKEEYGVPVRLIFLNREEVTSAKLIWQIVIKPKERKTSEVSKLLFRAFMQDILPLGPNMEYVKEKAASVWEENPQKLFGQSPEQLTQELQANQAQQAEQGGTVSPRVNLPTPEKAGGQEINRELKTGL